MREFTFQFTEEDGLVTVAVGWGNEKAATPLENTMATLFQSSIIEKILLNPPGAHFLGHGTGDSPEEAREAIQTTLDILKAGKPPSKERR